MDAGAQRGSWGRAIACACAIFIVLIAASGGLSPATSAQSPPPLVAAWMPPWDWNRALASFRSNATVLAEVSPVWYFVQSDGSLGLRSNARDPALLAEARAAGVWVLPTVTNASDPARISAILNDPARRQAHVDDLMAEVLAYDLDGLDLDYEFLYHSDRDAFTSFVTTLGGRLHALGKRLTLAAQAKTFDAWDWDGVGALDYAALGAVVDELRLMTYGWCWASGCVGSQPPGPIAPLHWQERVVAYAAARVDRGKLVLGVHLYGYDWPAPQTAPAARPDLWPHPSGPQANKTSSGPDGVVGTALTWPGVKALIDRHQPQVEWWIVDDLGRPVGEHWFRYGDDHTVVFAERDSVSKRWQLAQRLGLRGIDLWYAGAEDPAIWSLFPAAGAWPTPAATPTSTATATPTFAPAPTPTATVTPSPTPALAAELYLPIMWEWKP